MLFWLKKIIAIVMSLIHMFAAGVTTCRM